MLSKIWGNPPDSQTLGMLVPAKVSVTSQDGWAVIITYDEDGYVKDDDAAKLDYGKLLKEMQEGTREANEERKKEGYPGIELVGWAAPPRYDAGDAQNVLGQGTEIRGKRPRHAQLQHPHAGPPRRARAQCGRRDDATPGDRSRHARDPCDGGFSRRAPLRGFQRLHRQGRHLWVAALVAGGIAAKAGLFKGLIAALIAAKKLVIVGILAIGTFLKKLFGKKETPPLS